MSIANSARIAKITGMSETDPSTTSPSIRPYVLVFVGVLLWSTGGFFIKYTSLDAVTVNLGRSMFAAIVVAVFTYTKGLRPDAFTILTSLLYAATLTSFVYANKNTTAANAIFLQYTAPVYILMISPFVLKEKFAWSDLVTVVLCLLGMAMFFADSGEAQATAPNVVGGNIAGLVSGVFFGLYFVFLRHPRSLTKNPAISVFYGNIIIVLVMLPFVIGSFAGGQTIGTSDILAVAFLGIFQIGIAYVLFTNGIAGGIRSMDASVIGFFEPLLNPVWVFIMLGERPSRWALIGGIIIIATVAIHTFAQFNSRHRGREVTS